MIDRQKLDALAEDIAAHYGVTIADVYGRSQLPAILAARNAMIATLFAAGYTPVHFADAFAITHRAVRRARKAHVPANRWRVPGRRSLMVLEPGTRRFGCARYRTCLEALADESPDATIYSCPAGCRGGA